MAQILRIVISFPVLEGEHAAPTHPQLPCHTRELILNSTWTQPCSPVTSQLVQMPHFLEGVWRETVLGIV